MFRFFLSPLLFVINVFVINILKVYFCVWVFIVHALMDYKFFFTALYDFWLRFRVEKFSHDSKTFPLIVKCAVLHVSNHIYIFCKCALPKKDSHMDDKIPLRHTYIIHHVLAYNCHLVMTCRNTSIHDVMNILLMVMSVPWELKTIDLLFHCSTL